MKDKGQKGVVITLDCSRVRQGKGKILSKGGEGSYYNSVMSDKLGYITSSLAVVKVVWDTCQCQCG